MRRGSVQSGRHRGMPGPPRRVERSSWAGRAGAGKRKARIVSGAAVVRSLLGAVVLAVLLLGWGLSQAASPVVLPESALTASPQTSAQLESLAGPQNDALQESAWAGMGSPPLHITYAAVGMDQAVLPLSPTEQEQSLGSIVPPHTSDAYWLTPYGILGPGSTNTTYIVGHSWEGQGSPFNNISSNSRPGDELTVTTAEGPLVYRVDEITTENKDTLRDSAIWDMVPGRLIVITCFTEDLWGKNVIVQASPLEAEKLLGSSDGGRHAK